MLITPKTLRKIKSVSEILDVSTMSSGNQSPRYGVSSSYGWRTQRPDMKRNCDYSE